jgi:hypothetical protein
MELWEDNLKPDITKEGSEAHRSKGSSMFHKKNISQASMEKS